MTPAKRQASPQAVKKRGFQEKRDSTEEQGRGSIPASDQPSEPGSSGDRAGISGDGAACTSGESNNEEPQQVAQQAQASDPAHVQAHGAEPQSNSHLPSRTTSSGAHTPTQSKKRKASAAALKPGGRPKLPRPEGVAPCPRCNSFETKFCYYNNYNIKQPRYFCKACQRYWTAGGTLRNVPVGAGRRKHKNHLSRQQAKDGQEGSVQTHVTPNVHLDQFRLAMMEHPLQGPLATGIHPALVPTVGLTLPHMAPTPLPVSVHFGPGSEVPGVALGNGCSAGGPQNSRPGSSLGRSCDTLARVNGHGQIACRSVHTKTGNGSNGSNPTSAENNRSDEGSVHLTRGNMRGGKSGGANLGERATGETSADAGALRGQAKAGSEPLPGSHTPSPPAAPSNGTFSHDSGALLPNSFTSFPFPVAQASGETSFGTRGDVGSTAGTWLTHPHPHPNPHQLATFANLHAHAQASLLAPASYPVAAWNPYTMYPSTFVSPPWAAAHYARSMTTGSWQVESATAVAPQPCPQTSLAMPIAQGTAKDATLMAGASNGQMFQAWPSNGMAGMPFTGGWSQEPAPWQQNWGQLPTSSGGASMQPFIMLPPTNNGSGGSGLSGSSGLTRARSLGVAVREHLESSSILPSAGPGGWEDRL